MPLDEETPQRSLSTPNMDEIGRYGTSPEPGFPQMTLGGGKRARPSPSDVLFTAFHIPPAAGGTLNVLVACVNKI